MLTGFDSELQNSKLLHFPNLLINNTKDTGIWY